MRILHIYDHTEPLQSGYVTRSRTLREALEKQGHKCDVLSSVRHFTSSDQTYRGDDMIGTKYFFRSKPHSVTMPFLREINDIRSSSKHILELIERYKYDVIHAHSPFLCGYAALWARWICERYKIKIVYEIRAFWEDASVNLGRMKEDSFKYNLCRKLETHLCRQVDHVYTICEGLKKELIGRKIPEEKITLIPNVVDVNNFTFQKEISADIAAKHNIIPGDHRIIGFIGSFY
ncbi:MAG: glycosyltransferase, partial [Pseudomonadota bacterium]